MSVTRPIISFGRSVSWWRTAGLLKIKYNETPIRADGQEIGYIMASSELVKESANDARLGEFSATLTDRKAIRRWGRQPGGEYTTLAACKQSVRLVLISSGTS